VGTDALLRTEWLLTNGTGGFAMGTALGALTRRYHGLLVASLRPPVARVMALKAVAETLVIDPGLPSEERLEVSTFRFRPGVLHPRGDQALMRFEKGVGARWVYQFKTASGGDVAVEKHVHLFRDAPAVGVRYTVSVGGGRRARLLLRPLLAIRDFHGLQLRDTSRDRYGVEAGGEGGRGCVVHAQAARLHLKLSTGTFQHVEQWWNDFQYDLERERGYDYLEDLFHPGHFEAEIPAGQAKSVVTLTAGVNGPCNADFDTDADLSRKRRADLCAAARPALGGREPSPTLAGLIHAADDFVVRRVAPPTGALAAEPERATVIAGYPWFADWGRDSMISLPGLFFVAGRHHEARDVLVTFAKFRKGGLIPNVFDDYTGEAHYNTVDASLWFIHAACQYLAASGDQLTFKNELLPACLDVVASYRRGTDFGIGVDPADGLVFAGDPSTQLTWMDAKRDGVAFTPRFGKPVEINALWYNALASLVACGVGIADAEELSVLRDKVGLALRTQFWNAQLGCLFDSLAPVHGGGQGGSGWQPQREVRPNQILAVSLPHSAMEPLQGRAIVAYVKSRLLTTHALRTLDPADSRYKGRYRGTMFVRDSAYHNGTAWPWLMGPLAEAILRVGKFSAEARKESLGVLRGLLDFLDGDCPGQLPEIFDGDDPKATVPGVLGVTIDEPQRSGGCPAQAWSVAEPLRVLALIEEHGG
jgi:predicted glycogen debranching enzyme